MYIGDTGERGSPPPRLRGRRQLDRRGAGRLLQPHRRDDPRRQQRHGRGRRPRHPGRHASRPRACRPREVVLTKLHAGGKFDKGAYKVSGGLHGVGVSVVNALSETLEIEVTPRRQGLRAALPARRARGAAAGDRRHRPARHARSPSSPTRRSSRRIEFSFDLLSQRLRELAFLNRGVQHHDRGRARPEVARVPLRGRHRLVRRAPEQGQDAHPPDVDLPRTATRDGVEVEIALQWNDGYAENVFAFANNINTIEGGTHLIGLQVGAHAHDQRLRRSPTACSKKDEEALQGDDVREGLTAVISVKVPRAAVRGADQDQARQQRGEGHGRGAGQRPARRSYLEEHPAEREAHRREGHRGRARARGDAQGEGPRPPQGRARRRLAAREAGRLPGARPGALASSTSSRAIRPAARPSRAAIARTRRSCRCAARS